MTQRFDYIDCLRGLAIAMVMLVHCGQKITGLPDYLQSLTTYGGRGVQLFFILSALTLVSVYREHFGALRSFYIRRFFRIAPMFYLAIVFYLGWYGLGPRADAPNGIRMREIFLTLTFLHGLSWNSINSVVPGGWTIASEAMFYAIFPLLLRWLLPGRRTWIVFGAALLIARLNFVMIPAMFAGETTPELLHFFAYASFPTQLPAFIGGFVVVGAIQWLDAHRDHWLWNKRMAHALLACVAVAILGCAISGDPRALNCLTADALLMLLVIAVYLAQPRVFINACLRHLGRVSYSIYLVHFAVLDVLQHVLMPYLSAYAAASHLLVIYACGLAMSLAIATLSGRLIETPMIVLGHRIAARYEPSVSA